MELKNRREKSRVWFSLESGDFLVDGGRPERYICHIGIALFG